MAMRGSPGNGQMPYRRKPMHQNQQLGRALALAQDTARSPPPGGSLGGPPPGVDPMFASRPGGPGMMKPGMASPPQFGPQYSDGRPQGGGGFKPPMSGPPNGFGPMMSDGGPMPPQSFGPAQISPEMMAAFTQMGGGQKPMLPPPPPNMGPMPGRPSGPAQFPGPPMEQIPQWQRMR